MTSAVPPETTKAPANAATFDVVVIGAGAAGLVLTDILSRNNLRVCLLEAGPDNLKDRNEPFKVHNLLKEHYGVNNDRVTVFGGATNLWGGGLIRLTASDFRAIDGRPDTQWPIAFESMTEHYEAIEAIFGFSAAPEGPKNTVIDKPELRVRRREIPVLPFRVKNFGNRFGPILRARSNVTIHCNAKVTRFCPAPDGGVAYLEVEIDGATRAISAPRYVISAGTVNTNLLADRVLKDCNAQDIKGEHGCFFHDHISFPIAILRPKSPYRFSKKFGYRFENKMMYGEHFDIETKQSTLPGAFLHLAFDMSTSSILRPVREILNAIQRRTINLKGVVSLKDIPPLILGIPRLGIVRYIHKRLYLDQGARILATIDLEQYPLKEWRIGCGTNGSVCDLSWDVTEDDAAVAKKFIPICREILEQLKREADFEVEDLLGEIASDPAKLLAHMRREGKDTSHSSGGLRMSADAQALVDPDLRLRPVPNVHVLSSAVFPRVGTSNSTHTILALGHRLAMHLLKSQ